MSTDVDKSPLEQDKVVGLAVSEAEAQVEETYQRARSVKAAFSPSAPITSRDLFSGRVAQLARVLDLPAERGLHGVIYGERGVGKTSLASVCSTVLVVEGQLSMRVNCGENDTFTSVWRNVFRGFRLNDASRTAGFAGGMNVTSRTADTLLPDGDLMPEDVRRCLEIVTQSGDVVIFIDEFDRLPLERARAPFADTLKALADYGIRATVVLVGVADDVNDLVAQHRSIERGLAQILMPRMSEGESADIVNRGLTSVGMTIEEKALEGIVKLSQGLPSCTHLLAQGAAVNCVWNERDEVTFGDFQAGIQDSIDNIQQTIKDDYSKATSSHRKNNLYPAVLRACALTRKDDLGYFAPADVRQPLCEITGRSYDIPTFQQHLTAFTTAERASVLQRKGEPRRFRYRFRNPLLQPFVVMKGMRDDAIPA